MNRTILIIDFVTAFIIGFGGAGTAGLVVLLASGGKLNELTVVVTLAVMILAGLMTAAKSLRARLSMPPLENGNGEKLEQLLKQINERQK